MARVIAVPWRRVAAVSQPMSVFMTRVSGEGDGDWGYCIKGMEGEGGTGSWLDEGGN